MCDRLVSRRFAGTIGKSLCKFRVTYDLAISEEGEEEEKECGEEVPFSSGESINGLINKALSRSTWSSYLIF